MNKSQQYQKNDMSQEVMKYEICGINKKGDDQQHIWSPNPTKKKLEKQ